jgi:peroxiredoxin Q/BCP
MNPGDPAPDFTLKDQDGKPFTLSKQKGSIVVLYFYPKDDTPGCAKEACEFRDGIAEFKKLGAKVVGISADDSASHQKFADKFSLPFPLLADTEKSVCQAYDVWKEKNMYGKKSMGIVRTTVIVDQKGTIARVFPRVRVDGHADAVVEAIKLLEA